MTEGPRQDRPAGVATLGETAQHAKRWLFESAAPLWIEPTSSASPFFPERLTLSGQPDAAPHRLFVQARHIYSFCEIGRMGWQGAWRERVAQTLDFVIARGRRADGFYIHRFSPDGSVLDSRADLYDQAFMLLALAHASRALERPDLLRAAEALDDALESHWRLGHGGYFEGEVAVCPPFRQNPHMHLLESFVALYEVSGDARWRERAERIVDLAQRYFIDAGTGALLEYFDASLAPLAGEEGRIVEPGHCFEWAWLFETVAAWGLPQAIALSDGLAAFGRRYGLDTVRGVAINEVWLDGRVRNDAARLWPQTERLKIAAARWRRTGAAEERVEALAAFKGLSRYFSTPTDGSWRDKWRADGGWVEEPSPGSSFYHIACALSEMIDTAR